MRTLIRLLASIIALLPGGCAAGKPLHTVEKVDLQRYLGDWYEIASFPNRFQKGCVASMATYTLEPDGRIGVFNQCREKTLDGPVRSVRGTARVVDTATNAKLKVTFFWPFYGSYWVIDLDPDYRWAVVGHPGRNYLWVLSRTPVLDTDVYEGILGRLRGQDYDVTRLRRTPQLVSIGTP